MATKTNGHKRTGRRGHLTYGAYVFKSQDPIIGELRTMVQDKYGGPTRKITYSILKKIEDDGGATVSCMVGWGFVTSSRKKLTMRPQNATIEATGRSMGYERVWRRMKE